MSSPPLTSQRSPDGCCVCITRAQRAGLRLNPPSESKRARERRQLEKGVALGRRNPRTSAYLRVELPGDFSSGEGGLLGLFPAGKSTEHLFQSSQEKGK